MTSKAAIDRFVEGKTLALVGASASGKGFGNTACKELRGRGYRVLPVHPSASQIQGQACWRSLAELPERVERLLVAVPPESSADVVREAASVGIRQVWLQQGAESAAVIRASEELGLELIHGHCILMFAGRPGGIHGFHRWLWNLLGKIPS